ncbi:polysaccharide biosynthesis protein [Jiella sp. CQZ9-1]|uniref:Polysaccharide biosynthesis protein n=2 Tax=Jiella flava TaxID=2816857 RepID=A0A939G0Z0_9HYPH|nr:polysaccharide biosynthesis protein [Jiella flava]
MLLLYGAVATSRLLSGPSTQPWPPQLGRHEVLAYLKRRIRQRLAAVIGHSKLYTADIAAAALAYTLAVIVRIGIDGHIAQPLSTAHIAVFGPYFVLCAAILFPATCLYSRNWRYATVSDLFGVARAALVVTLAFVGVLFALDGVAGFPRSIVVIALLLLMPMLVALRLRSKVEEMRSFAPNRRAVVEDEKDLIPVLLIGADDGADIYLRALQRDDSSRHRPVGILCKDAPQGSNLRGVPVLGTPGDFSAVLADLEQRDMRPRQIVVTNPVAGLTDPQIKRVMETSDRLGIAVSRPAPAVELRSGKSTGAMELRPIELTDLLERPQAALDKEALRRMIEGRRVVVTGAGGSIGSELTLQIASFAPTEIVLIESTEFNLYQIDLDLSEKYPAQKRVPYLCNVRDRARLDAVFSAHRPELVFHAAALKHVPMVELNPCEGILTNAIGTMNVAEATRRYGALAMVQISTDKVVNATSMMGATKRLAELYCQALDLSQKGSERPTRFMTVRFGNVLGSSGSLIPLFQRQLARGGPLTITDLEMKRFFMTIREAVELTLQASAHGLERQLGQGEIFVLDMGEPIKIVDMARRMIRLAGLRPDIDVKIKVVGRRPGEKLFEELFDEDEERVASAVPGVLGAVPTPVPLDDLRQALQGLELLARGGSAETARDRIAGLLPGYQAEPAAPSQSGAMHLPQTDWPQAGSASAVA